MVTSAWSPATERAKSYGAKIVATTLVLLSELRLSELPHPHNRSDTVIIEKITTKYFFKPNLTRHCEERSDEAIQ
jgi:hypothetical protein